MNIKRALALLLTLCMVLGVAGPGLTVNAEAASNQAVKVEHNGETTYYASLQKAFDGFAPSNNTYGGTYVVTLMEDVSGNLSKNLQYPTEVLDVTLDLNGHTITGDGSTIAVVVNFGSANAKDCKFTIKDSSGDNSGKITGGKGGVKLDGKGSFLYFEGGTITGNHGSTKGGGILMGATAKLIMTGGVITGNSVTGSSSTNTGLGGGVLANYADILGGEIYGNEAKAGTGNYTGRGGGLCTEVTRTKGYSTLNIADGVIYGNTAASAGDDVMAQGNGMASTKFALIIGTENWYIDGWNGNKMSAGATDRYSAENPVAYTDGGFTGTVNADGTYAGVSNITLGLKYIKPAAPSVSEYTVTYTDGVDGEEIFADQTYTVEEGKTTPAFDGTPVRAGYNFLGWEPAVAETVTADATYVAQWGKIVLEASGDIARAYLNPSKGSGRIYVDLLNVTYNESVQLKLYSGEKLLTTASLNTTEYPAPQTRGELTGSICVVAGESDTWPNTEWLAFDNVIPDKIELVVDGSVMEVFTNIQASRNGGAMTAEDWAAFPNTMAVPALPQDNGGNVTSELITIICDTDGSHTAQTYGWGDPAANSVFPTGSEPVWNEELNAWTIGVRIDSIGTYYVWDRFEGTCNGINHEIVKGAPLTSDEYYRIDTTLVWNAASLKWQTLTGEPFVIHTTCQTVPNDPTFFDVLRNYQIKVIGTVAGEEMPYFVRLDESSVEIGHVTGDREQGFTCQVTITLKDGDTYVTTWMEKKAPGVPYVYDFEKTTNPIVLTLTYTGDLAGELNGDWTLGITGNTVATAYVAMDAPAAPEKFGSNVTPNFVEVICDSDPIHHPSVVYKWMQQSAKVVQGAVPVWNAEVGAWTIDVKVDSISMYYVLLSFDKAYGVNHDLVGENYFVGTLKWDGAQQLWVPLDGEPFEIHVTCKSVPDAPALMGSYQIQVKGDRDHNGVYGENGELFTTTIPADGCSFSEIYGSRDEGFFIDVTVTLEDGDIYITNWIDNRAPGEDYVYNWAKTAKTFTFTLTYAGDLNGNLQGSNDWVLVTTGESFGAVAEAFVVPAAPAKPEQKNVTEQLVAIICDSDGERHQTVYGKWYPLGHCTTTSDIVWNDELNTYVVDIRIGSLYIMYVDQLEDANNDTMHELAEDITSINSRLKWDYEQNLWVTLDGQPIELHTTCRTAPKAPEYKHIDGYQIKVWGDVDGTETAYTINLPEGSYTLSEVRGSREEGFFVDVTITLADGDAFVTSWIEKKVDPGITYVYDTERTEMTITFTLRYNGDLDGTLYGDRHAANTNYDWIIGFNHNNYPLTYGVIAEAYVVHHHLPGEPATCTEPQLCMECGVELHPSLEDALAQAIVELEKAIADGDKANAEALTEAVAKLEKAIADIAANGESIADLEAAVAQLQEAVVALEEAYKAADAALKDELEAAIAQAQEALQATIGALAERVAQNETNITALQEALAKAMKDLNDAIAAGDEANAEALAKAVEAMEKALADAVAALEKADAENKAALDALEALIAEARATLEAAIAQLRSDLEDAVDNLENADKENAEALAKAIEDLTAAIKAAEDSAAAELTSAKASLQAAIAQVQKNLNNAEAALKRAIAAGDAALAQKIDDLNAALSAAIAASNAADEALKTELTAAIAAGDATLQAAIDAVAQNLAKAEQELTAAIAAGDQDLDHKITLLNEGLTVAIAAADAANEALRTELNARIDEAVATLEAAVAQVQKNLDNAEATLKEKDAQHDAELDRLNTFVTVVCVIASLALVGCAALLVITIIGKRKKV